MQITFWTSLLEATLMCHGNTREQSTVPAVRAIHVISILLRASYVIYKAIVSKSLRCVKNNVKLRVKRFGKCCGQCLKLFFLQENMHVVKAKKNSVFIDCKNLKSHVINTEYRKQN